MDDLMPTEAEVREAARVIDSMVGVVTLSRPCHHYTCDYRRATLVARMMAPFLTKCWRIQDGNLGS